METEYKLGDSEEPATLQKMGMVRAFVDPRLADGARFDGMCESTDPDYRLYITGVFHKAFVEVNEKGTEAAAATAVAMKQSLNRQPRDVPFTPEFKADRPFVFLIRDNVNRQHPIPGPDDEPDGKEFVETTLKSLNDRCLDLVKRFLNGDSKTTERNSDRRTKNDEILQ